MTSASAIINDTSQAGGETESDACGFRCRKPFLQIYTRCFIAAGLLCRYCEASDLEFSQSDDCPYDRFYVNSVQEPFRKAASKSRGWGYTHWVLADEGSTPAYLHFSSTRSYLRTLQRHDSTLGRAISSLESAMRSYISMISIRRTTTNDNTKSRPRSRNGNDGSYKTVGGENPSP